jgi:two-component system response regulator YesN
VIKLLIVDDETVIRKGLRTSIDWDLYGIHVVGEAKNGQEALEKALTLRPEIILTDIRMPIMDGLTFISAVRAKLPAAKIIVLSGYDEFEYAQRALRLGVSDYLLKPFGAEELLELILRLKEKLLAEQKQLEQAVHTRSIMEKNRLTTQAELIQALLDAAYDDYTPIFEKARLVQLNLDGPFYQVVVFNIDDQELLTANLPHKEKDFIKSSALNIAGEVLQQYWDGAFCPSEPDYFVGLVNLTENPERPLVEVCREIQATVRKYLKFTISIGIGAPYNSVKRIPDSYQEALRALGQKVYQGKNSLIHIQDLPPVPAAMLPIHPAGEEMELLKALKSLDEARIDSLLEATFAAFRRKQSALEEVKNYCIKLAYLSIYTLEAMGVQAEHPLGAEPNLYVAVRHYETMADLEGWLRSLLGKLLQNLNSYKAQKYKQVISQAIEYLQQHYQESVTLKTLADAVYVSPNYLSRIFKEETGENFVEWLNKFRIERAKELLRDRRLKTYEIAEKVGYSDYKYFSYNFKKYTGRSTRQYLEENR